MCCCLRVAERVITTTQVTRTSSSTGELYSLRLVFRLGLNNCVHSIDFPVVLTFVAFICMLANGVLFGTHRKLVNSQSLLSIFPYI